MVHNVPISAPRPYRPPRISKTTERKQACFSDDKSQIPPEESDEVSNWTFYTGVWQNAQQAGQTHQNYKLDL